MRGYAQHCDEKKDIGSLSDAVTILTGGIITELHNAKKHKYKIETIQSGIIYNSQTKSYETYWTAIYKVK